MEGTRSHVAAAWARAVLPSIVLLLLLAAWWLSLVVVIDTSIVNLTPPKIIALVAIPILLIARFRQLIARSDLPIIVLLVGYVTWLLVAAVLRGSAYDVKLTGGYAVFFGAAASLAYASGRARPRVAARGLIIAVVVALAVTLLGAILERFTYPGPEGEDPVGFIWEFVRPQEGLAADPESSAGRQPLHFASGDLSIPRVASWFAHANYLAFFAFLAAALCGTLMLVWLRASMRGPAILAASGLVACAVISAWTYSRAGLLGLLGVVVAVPLVDMIATRAPWRVASAVARAAPLAIVLVTLGASLVFDEVGLRRFSPIVTDPPAAEAPEAQGAPEEPSIEVSAARSSQLRIVLQATALRMVVEDPTSSVLGPGMAAFDAAIHDPASTYYVRGAEGIVDPNSLWLTAALAGGVVALIALAIAVVAIEIRLLRAVRTQLNGPSPWTVRWLAAWLPTWALVQFVGTNPFNPSEAMILGAILGMAVGLTSQVPRAGAAVDA